jgi:hypothetical protein
MLVITLVSLAYNDQCNNLGDQVQKIANNNANPITLVGVFTQQTKS